MNYAKKCAYGHKMSYADQRRGKCSVCEALAASKPLDGAPSPADSLMPHLT
jgi:hypothetical protein